MSNPNKVVIEAANGPKRALYPHLCQSDRPANPIINNVVVSGNTVYLAGVLGTDSEGKLVSGGVKKETVQALKNASERLGHVGLDLSDGESSTELADGQL